MRFDRIQYFTISRTCLYCGEPVDVARVMQKGARIYLATICQPCAIMEVDREVAKQEGRAAN